MRERVAITGAGVVTPIGIGIDAYAAALRCGQSGIGRINAFDCRGFQTQLAAEISAPATFACGIADSLRTTFSTDWFVRGDLLCATVFSTAPARLLASKSRPGQARCST